MLTKEKPRIEWDPAEMKRDFDALVEEIELRLYESHVNLMSMAGSGHMAGDVARLRAAIGRRADTQAALQRMWSDVDHSRNAATFAVGELLRALPRDERTRAPLLHVIPVATPSTATEEWKPDRDGRMPSIINTSQKLRGLAHEADNKLVVFKTAVQRYRDFRTIAQPKIRWALYVEEGRSDEEIARLDQAEATAEPIAPARREAEPLSIDVEARS
ncbi:MAG: hypothetical protein JWM53_5992 [bacterium]|nr:hypothetical protein [bacterium]